MTTIRVEYVRTDSEAGTYSSSRVGGAVELSLADAATWPQQWETAYGELKAIVDAAATSRGEPPAPSTTQSAADARNDETRATSDGDTTAEVSQQLAALVGKQVAYANCRVMWDPDYTAESAQRRAKVRMKVNNPEIPGGGAYAKSFEPDIISTARSLRKGDMVNVAGTFDKPWRNSKSGQDQYDIVLTSIERIK